MNTEANKSNNEHSFRGLFVKVFFVSHKSWIKNSLYLQSLKINRRTTNVPFEVYSLRLSLVLKNLELKAIGATPQFKNICAQNDISVQHLGSPMWVTGSWAATCGPSGHDCVEHSFAACEADHANEHKRWCIVNWPSWPHMPRTIRMHSGVNIRSASVRFDSSGKLRSKTLRGGWPPPAHLEPN